jgi:RNA polymerase sigma factor (sigma-70 family)
MPTESVRPLAQQLLRAVLVAADVSDRDLLARFVSSRDEEAFTEIVRRHGPMVLAVCRRVTRRPHDAEDAFQATFLVLARRAAHVGRPELLANWLYGVAYRTALETRTIRRRIEERVVPSAPEPTAPPQPDDVADLRCIIDEELAKLPEKHRTAIVLCDLEGLSRAAAAIQMGIPQGTLSSRLAYARKLLAERLTRRGVTASAATIAAALGRDAVATAIPRSLMSTTILAAVRFIPGGTVPPGVSPAVSSLTEGVLKTMLVTRLRQLFAVGLLTCGLIGVGAALAQQLGPQATSPDTSNAPVVASEPYAQWTPEIPKAAPLKSVAKGVEDEDVPYPSPPKLAVVRLEDGKLIVRQRSYYYVQVPVVVNDGSVMTIEQKRSGVNVAAVDAGEVAAFDMKGNRLPSKEWKETLKTDRLVLISADSSLPNPRELSLFKPETLLLVVPQQSTAPPAGGFYVGGFSYTPLPAASPPPVAQPPIVPNQPTPTIPFANPTPASPSITPLPNSPTPPLTPVEPPASTLPPVVGMPSLPPPTTPRNDPPRAFPLTPPPGFVDYIEIRGSVLKDIEVIHQKGLNVINNVVEISIGLDAGLEEGSELDIGREANRGTYLGKLSVKKVNPKTAVCEFKPARQVPLEKLRDEELPRKGDSVQQWQIKK